MYSQRLPVSLLILILLLAATFAQSSSYSISGELRAESGSLFSGATVCAIPVDGSIVRLRDKVCTESDPQGKFIVQLTQGGKYQVISEKRSEGYLPAYVPFYRDPKVAIPEVNLTDENRHVSLSLALAPKSGVITGKVIDEATDEPIQNFTVWVWQSRNRSAATHEVVTGINSPGSFRLFVPPVEVTLRVTAEGYEPWVTGGGVLISAAGAKKGPGWFLIRSGSHRDLVVYLKKANQTQAGPTPGDAQRLPAPTQLSPADNLVIDSLPLNVKLEWSPVTGAVAYDLQLEACSNPSAEALSRLGDDGECINPTPYQEKFGLTSTIFELSYPYAQPARWRVWAVDKDHRRGFKSPWRRWVYPVRIIK